MSVPLALVKLIKRRISSLSSDSTYEHFEPIPPNSFLQGLAQWCPEHAYKELFA